jgi:excisionase family DNA binding protein
MRYTERLTSTRTRAYHVATDRQCPWEIFLKQVVEERATAVMSVNEVARELRISLSKAKQILAAQTLRSFHCGRRRLILRSEFERFLQELSTEGDAGREPVASTRTVS